LNSDHIWAQSQYGDLRFSSNGGLGFLPAQGGIGGADRRNWNSPLIQDPLDPDVRYFGTNRVYRSTGDRSWTVISPDLTGGPHSGNPGQVFGTLTTLSASALDNDVIWAGSDDGHVNVTTDGGGSWQDVSGTLPDRWVTAVRADPFTVGGAWVTISGYRWNEPLPRVYRSFDQGLSWQPVAGNLPDAPVNDLLADPDRPDRCFVATDVGVFETTDGGTTWSMLAADLPNVVTTSLALDRDNQVLVVGTYGRSAFSTVIHPDHVFADGFESGDTSAWSVTVE
jgi:hypothetical protein